MALTHSCFLCNWNVIQGCRNSWLLRPAPCALRLMQGRPKLVFTIRLLPLPRPHRLLPHHHLQPRILLDRDPSTVAKEQILVIRVALVSGSVDLPCPGFSWPPGLRKQSTNPQARTVPPCGLPPSPWPPLRPSRAVSVPPQVLG